MEDNSKDNKKGNGWGLILFILLFVIVGLILLFVNNPSVFKGWGEIILIAGGFIGGYLSYKLMRPNHSLLSSTATALGIIILCFVLAAKGGLFAQGIGIIFVIAILVWFAYRIIKL